MTTREQLCGIIQSTPLPEEVIESMAKQVDLWLATLPQAERLALLCNGGGPSSEPKPKEASVDAVRTILSGGPCGRGDVAKALYAEPRQVGRVLAQLVKDGEAAARGKGRGKKYHLSVESREQVQKEEG